MHLQFRGELLYDAENIFLQSIRLLFFGLGFLWSYLGELGGNNNESILTFHILWIPAFDKLWLRLDLF